MGFDSSRVITASITLHPGKYRVPGQQLAFFDQLLDRTRRMPGVVLAALSDSLPPTGQARSMIFSNIEVEGRPLPSEGTGGMVTWRSVTAGYFEALQIPMLRGRSFMDEDRHASEPAVIVSERLNRKLFANENALGKRIRFGRGEQPWHIVVGIARDIRNAGLAVEPEPEYYVAQRMMPRDANRRGFVVVRTQADPAISSSFLRAEIAGLDPELPVTIQKMDERVAELAARPRFTAWLLIAFAGVALILACTGLSGVATYLVTQRTRDIGVRMALGATPANVSSAVLREAARWVGAGALMGILLSWTTSKLLASFLHGVTPSDPMTWGIVMLLLSATLGLAVLRPALRAARIDPMNALRCD
jgi:predicted permease